MDLDSLFQSQTGAIFVSSNSSGGGGYSGSSGGGSSSGGGGGSTASSPRVSAHDSTWLDVRVFVSSTFVDMRTERHLLNTEVFPQLELRFHDRNLNLSVTDLQWGIPTASEAADTVRFCREELRQSEIFLYLGAQRFGWVPDPEKLHPEDASDWLPGMSITAMEVVDGALRRDGANALFFLREASYNGTLPEDTRGTFVSTGSDAETQSAMHRELRRRFPHAIHPYAPGVPEGKGLSTWAAFVSTALEELTRMLEGMLPPPAASAEEAASLGATQQRLAEQHSRYVRRLAARAHPRPRVSELITSAAAPGSCALVQAPCGLGKSTSLALAAQEAAGRGGTVFMHFTDATPDSGFGAFATRLACTLAARAGLPSYVPSSTAAAASACAHWLSTPPGKAGSSSSSSPSSDSHLTIVLDSVDALQAPLHLALSWLPRRTTLHSSITLVLGAASPAVAEALGQLLGGGIAAAAPAVHAVQLPELAYEERLAVVSLQLRRLHKSLDPATLESLCSKPGCGSPLWLAIALRCLVRRAIHERLLATIQAYPDDLAELVQGEVAAVAAEVGVLRVRTLALALLAHQEGFVELEVPFACGYIEGQLTSSSQPLQPIPAADWTRLRSKLDFLFAPQGASKGTVRVSNSVLEAALFRAVAHPDSAEEDIASLRAAREALVAMYAAHPAVQPSRSARMRALLHCWNADSDGLLGALLCPFGLERLFWNDLVVREEYLGFFRAADGGRDSYSTAAEACERRANMELQGLAEEYAQQQQQQQLDILRHALNIGRALQLMGSLSKAARVLADVAQATRKCAAAAQKEREAQCALPPLAALHSEALLLAGRAAMDLGDFHGAFELLHECSALQAAPHPPTQLALGRCHFSVARYAPALAAVQLALQGTAPGLSVLSASEDEAAIAGGCDAVALAGIFEALGDISLALRRAPDALQHFQRAAALQRAYSGEMDAAVANLIGKVAQAHTAAGQCNLAQLALQGVLSVQEIALGARHPDLARTRVGLARVQAALGQPTACLLLLQAALAVQLVEEGEGSFGAATTLNNVAASLVEVGRYAEALTYFGRSLRAFSQCLGEDHPHTAGVLVNLSLAYELNDRLGDAIGCMKRAESIHARVFGAAHESTGELRRAFEALLKKAFLKGNTTKRRVVRRVMAAV